MEINNKTVIWIAILAGGVGGGLATANLITALKPYAGLITAGSTFLSAVVAYFVSKANGEKNG